ncbi:MAG: S-layer homology domain-containing protein [Oscillospiraceae bacterium]|nr:S-layer homology domain-containing protein [Oscillospiraceae bacterium]
MKRIVSLIVTVSLMISMIPMTAQAKSNDYATRGEVCEMLLTAADDYNPEVKKTDILKGYDDGELHEERNVTRAEALVMLKRAFGDIPELMGCNKLLAIPVEDFMDVPAWAQEELRDVFEAGIVAGTADGIFSPDDNVTKEQMRLFINRTFRVFGTNIRDDYYGTKNKALLDYIDLPEGYIQFGTMIDDEADYNVQKIIEEIAASDPKKGSKEEKIKNLYNNYINTDKRNNDGLGPFKEYIEIIDSVKSVSDLTEMRYDTELIADFFVNFYVSTDLKDSNTYVAYLNTPTAYDKQYFRDPQFEKEFKKYYKQLGILCGESEEQAAKDAAYCYEFEKSISNVQLTPSDRRDISAMYNVKTLEEIDDTFDTIDIKAIYDDTRLKNADKIIVTDENSVKHMAQMLNDSNIDMLKAAAKLEIVDSYSQYLSNDFVKANDEFTNYLYGIEGETNTEYVAAQEVLKYLSDYVGEVYAEEYDDPEVNADVRKMVDEIIEVYREKISSASWMSDTTKEKALLKLDTMRIKIGAPDKWNTYMDNAEILSYDEGGSLAENLFRMNDAIVEYMYSLEGTEVDKDEWVMYPYTVNASYYALNNDITITTAMLDTSVYKSEYKYEYNLGAIGSIIAHEITHAFDASGSQFDENGNLNSWWTEDDKKAFNDLCDSFEAYYDGLEGAPGIPISSELTLTENMADLGGIEIITAVADKHDDFDYDCMYDAYSFIWYSIMSRQTAQFMAINDVHSFPSIRVNRVLQSIDRFYEVYSITERDGMYVPPEERVHFWS